MTTYTQILYQIVFGTRYRQNTLFESDLEFLYKFIWGVLKKKKCVLYQIGGTENHIHIITHVHPSVPVSSLVKDIKLGSTAFIKEKRIFPNFNGWQSGFGAFTYDISAKENLMNYVRNQKEHHKRRSFEKEYEALLKSKRIDYNEKYLF